MSRRPKGEKRKTRSVMATDNEWQRIREDAAAAGLSISDHVLRVLLAPPSPPDTADQALPLRVHSTVARVVLVLECIERELCVARKLLIAREEVAPDQQSSHRCDRVCVS